MNTDSNIKPVTAKLVWDGTAQDRMPYAIFVHQDQMFTFSFVANGLNVHRVVSGGDAFLTQVDTVGEALEFVSLYTSQLI